MIACYVGEGEACYLVTNWVMISVRDIAKRNSKVTTIASLWIITFMAVITNYKQW
jgi:hypothetical protein